MPERLSLTSGCDRPLRQAVGLKHAKQSFSVIGQRLAAAPGAASAGVDAAKGAVAYQVRSKTTRKRQMQLKPRWMCFTKVEKWGQVARCVAPSHKCRGDEESASFCTFSRVRSSVKTSPLQRYRTRCTPL
eukprot:scaffold194338_cov28-Tisochrysis_lutea.AAC.4